MCGNKYEINDANKVNHPENILYKLTPYQKNILMIILKFITRRFKYIPTTYSEIYDSQQNTYNVSDAGYTISTSDNIILLNIKKL